MTNLFFEGGPVFMGFLTLILLVLLVVVVTNVLLILKNEITDKQVIKERLSYVKSIGLFALITGILGQSVGLFFAFTAMRAAGDIIPALVAGGLRTTMICPIYGMIIFLIAYLIWFGLVALNINRSKDK